MKRFFSALMAASFFATAANAEIYSFYNITNNGSPDVGGQLQMEVTDAGGGQVDFKFTNVGSVASSITDIYFDDGTLLGIASITDSGGTVAFSQDASPGNLPGGNAVDFQTTAGFSADSDPPAQPNGVNPGEWVSIRFNLINGQTFANTLAALILAGEDGGLRVGLHIQGFGDGGSDSYVNGIVPVPAAVLLGAIGVGMVGWVKRRRMA